MDFKLASTRLADFIALIDAFVPVYERRYGIGWNHDGDPNEQAALDELDDSIRGMLPVVRAIAEATDFPHSDELGDWPESFTHHWGRARKAAVQLRGAVDSSVEIQQIVGSKGPQLAAHSLHPLVWSAAAKLYDDGHPSQAVQAAATAIEGQLQAKLQRPDRSGSDLAAAFSLSSSKSDLPRLTLPGFDPESKTHKSAHEGAAALVRGSMLAIRNPASHPGTPDLSSEEALEQLASLSLLARMIDRAEVSPRDPP